MLNEFKIAETVHFRKQIDSLNSKKLYSKIESFIYPQFRRNPFFGPNIKKLKGELEGYYRFRIGGYRLFYTVDKQKVIVFILGIADRKDSYK